MQENLDVGVTSVGITIGTSGTDVSVTGSPVTSSGNITINIPTASATNRGLLSAADWSTFNSKQQAITLTTTGTSGAATLVSGTLNIPNYSTDLSGYVTLGTAQTITAQKTFTTSGSSDTMIISHGSGSGFALDVLKAGNGEAIRVTKTSGSGNAMTISGGNFEAPTIVKTGGTSSQFLKADGSVDSTAYTTNTGTVTSVGLSSATSGVTIGSSPITTSGTITLAIATASGSQNGLLSSTDWTTFNGKQSALNGTGFVKISGTTISYDNSTYLTTGTAASTYLPLTGGTLTGALNGTSATFSTSTISGAVTTSINSQPVTTSHYINHRLGNGYVTGRGTTGETFISGNTDLFTATITGASSYLSQNVGALYFFNAPSVSAGATPTFTQQFIIASTGEATFSSSVTAATAINVTGNGGFFNAANKFGLDHFAGASRFYSSGSNSSTKGGYEFHTNSSDGSLDVIALGIASTGVATFSGATVIGTAATGKIELNQGTGNPNIEIFGGAGSNSVGGSAYYRLRDQTNSQSSLLQINASGGLDFWFQYGGTFYNRATISNTGAATFSSSVTATATGAATFSSTVATTGIKFPATQVASADANTLDDYEEGTWSPDVDAQTGTYVMVFGSRGTYTKIGRVVTVQYYFRVVNKGTGSGTCILSNLPFASLTTSTDDSYTGTGIRQGNYLNTLVINQNSSSINITENTGDPIVQGQWNAGSITYFT
jgi:hypothetical protein